MLDKRTNVLLSSTDHFTLNQIAQKSGKSMGQVIREALYKTYNLNTQNTKKNNSVQNIKTLARKVDIQGISYSDLVNDGRKY